MSNKQERHSWLKAELKRNGLLMPNDSGLIEAFIAEFPEALKSSKSNYNYGSNPCKMLQSDCRELYLKGEFGQKSTISSGEGGKTLGLGTYSVIYRLRVCNLCDRAIPDSNDYYSYNLQQCCKECWEIRANT